ncbi:hypothetical protein SASPL_118059 [Salvia splendens]|uniref:Sorting nexin-13 n=1 Tax=Salvia splendens TaxID=180675 RepID=A0A8X8Y0M3_SALSN|nr:hypothetical protein SASPL_118059 [Salvia splendens]
MSRAMESIQDLIEEAKLRTVWWSLCIFAVSYFLTHSSKSMLMNIPIAILLVSGLRILLNEVEFRWKVWNNRTASYLSHLEKKQLSVNDSRLTTPPPPKKWKRKIDSPPVEAAIEDFVNKLLHDFVTDLWYSEITPDREAPELIYAIVMDVLGEVSARIKELNLVDLLTRDVVDLIGEHLDLFRRNQAAIGADVMGTLSSEERDERLKHHLLVSKELHPALISPESEYKVLQQLMAGLLAVVLRPREAQCPLVRCIARELLTCLVVQPLLNFASPSYINELIEYIILAYKNEGFSGSSSDQSPNAGGHNPDHQVSRERGQSSDSNLRKRSSLDNQEASLSLARLDHDKVLESGSSGNPLSSMTESEPTHIRHGEWAKQFEAATQRRTEVLMPENLENMWTIGRNYKKKIQKKAARGVQASGDPDSVSDPSPTQDLVTEVSKQKPGQYPRIEDKVSMQLPPRPLQESQSNSLNVDALSTYQEHNMEVVPKGRSSVYELDSPAVISYENRNKLKRSNSTSALTVQLNREDTYTSEGSTPIINEFYSADGNKLNVHNLMSKSDIVLRHEGVHASKLRCRVIGAYFEKLGSTSFAVYSIAVTDANGTTWFVKRRYRNFERLHRHLKDIANYTLHLPPKRIFSSSTEDAFVHQRCIQLDKYLQDLLSIANVAEQHEVWDFLSASSKNYSFGKSTSVMRSLAGMCLLFVGSFSDILIKTVNVDDAVDDILRQFKGVSDGLMMKVSGSPSSLAGEGSSVTSKNLLYNADDMNKLAIRPSMSESTNSFSDNEESEKDLNLGDRDVEAASRNRGWHSDHESTSEGLPQKVVKHNAVVTSIPQDTLTAVVTSIPQDYMRNVRLKSESNSDRYLENVSIWTPPNLSVPVLNLVDNVFQLKRRGWLRRQVFWISKQILQLVMEDAIDDWLLRKIQWLRRGDVVAQGIRWVQDILWPEGTFFLRLRAQQNNLETTQKSQQTTKQAGGMRATQSGSFEQHLEAARRASFVKKTLFNGAPTTLVSLIGHKQYKRCTKDLYYFLQSTVCLKQLGYGILELVLISIFPELEELVLDIHEKSRSQPV